MLTNPRLEALLRPLGTPAVDHSATPSNHSTATWEFFPPRLTGGRPLNEHTVAALDDCLRDRADEIDALRFECDRLAEQLGEVSPADAPRRVETHLPRHVAEDLAELLRLDERANGEYVAALSSDRATWAGLLTAAAAATHQAEAVTLAGGIAVAASIIAHGVQAIHERGQQLTASPYRLVYRLRQNRAKASSEKPPHPGGASGAAQGHRVGDIPL
jgi:hypothetical protein